MKHFVSFILVTFFTMGNFAFCNEGVSTEIDGVRVEALVAWTHNAKLELENGLDYAQKRPLESQEEYLRKLIDDVVGDSGSRQNEFLMRNILYRTQVIHEILLHVPRSVKRDATARRILDEGIRKAIELYKVDQRILPGREFADNIPRPVEFAKLGLEWSQYMISLSYSLPDNKSRLLYLASAIGLLYNDVADDSQYNRALAPVLKNIAEFKDIEMTKDLKSNTDVLYHTRVYRDFLQQQIKNIAEIFNIALVETKKADEDRGDKKATSAATEESIIPTSNRTNTKKMNKYSAHYSAKCADGYFDGEAYSNKDNMYTKYCVTVDETVDYITDDDHSCAPTHIPGMFIRSKDDFSNKICLAKASLGSRYVTDDKNQCLAGYSAGVYFENDDGIYSKICLIVLKNKEYLTDQDNRCASSHIIGEFLKTKDGFYSRRCLPLATLPDAYVTGHKKPCLKGYFDGEINVNAWGFYSKKCFKP